MFTPAPGWAIVRIVEPGKTEGGLHIPEIDGHGKVMLVAKSKGHFKAGVLVPCEAPLGARLLMMPNGESANSPLLPREHHLVQLHDILAWEVPADLVAIVHTVTDAH